MIKDVKITIFGANGGIGRLLVKQALNNGYYVRAYVRNPSKLYLNHPNLETIQGELHDYDKILYAISGVNAVISTLGPPLKRKYDDFSVLEGHENIIKAMETENIKRFITIATPSVRSAEDKPSLSTKMPAIMAKIFFPDAYKEIVQLGEVVKTSRSDWTIIRFIAPNNKPLSGKVKITFGDTKIKWGISRADIADFILKQTKNNQYVRSMPIIGS
jgi:putative NADH-flavin reductase